MNKNFAPRNFHLLLVLNQDLQVNFWKNSDLKFLTQQISTNASPILLFFPTNFPTFYIDIAQKWLACQYVQRDVVFFAHHFWSA